MKKIYKIKVNSKVYEVELEEVKEVDGVVESSNEVEKSEAVNKPLNATSTIIEAPMPGSIFDIKVTLGQSVKKGDLVAILEAMKMETEILASCDGTITSICVEKGKQVSFGEKLLTIN